MFLTNAECLLLDQAKVNTKRLRFKCENTYNCSPFCIVKARGRGSRVKSQFFLIFKYVKIQNLGIQALFTESKKLAMLISYEFAKLTRFRAFPKMYRKSCS